MMRRVGGLVTRRAWQLANRVPTSVAGGAKLAIPRNFSTVVSGSTVETPESGSASFRSPRLPDRSVSQASIEHIKNKCHNTLKALLPVDHFATMRQSESASSSVLRFHLVGFKSRDQVQLFVDECARRGVSAECARQTRQTTLPSSEASGPLLIDVKLPLEFEDDLHWLAAQLIAARRDVLGFIPEFAYG